MRTCYSLRGRTLFIEFKCGRCGKTHLEPYAKQAELSEGNLQCFKPPEGWQEDGLYNPLLCPECAEQFHRFINNEGDVVTRVTDVSANKLHYYICYECDEIIFMYRPPEGKCPKCGHLMVEYDEPPSWVTPKALRKALGLIEPELELVGLCEKEDKNGEST